MKTLISKRHSGIATPTLLLVVALLALAGVSYLMLGAMKKAKAARDQITAQEAELMALRETTAEVDRLRVQNAQIAHLREDSKELVQLRAEVATLRQAAQQVATLTTANQQLQAQVNQLKQAAGQASTLRTQNEALKSAITQRDEVQQKQVCIANLRQIQAAKVAWAEDNSKRPVDIPLDQELFGPDAYLPQKPECPTKGTYTLGDVQSNPTCSVPGHDF